MNSNLPVTPDENAPLNRIQITAWMVAWLALVIDVLDWQLLAMAAPHITKEFQFSLASMGTLLGAPLIGAGIGGLVSGWIADRIGRVKTMVWCMVWYSTMTVLFPFVTSFEQMLALRILAGLGLGGQWGVGNTLVAELLPRRIRIVCSAWIQTGFSFGPILAALTAKWIIPAYGWRPMFYVGAVGFLLALVTKFMVPEPPIWLQAREKASKGELKLGNLGMFFQKGIGSRFVLAFLMVGCTLIAYWSSMSWIPSWLASDKGMNVVKSMNYMVVLNIGGVFGYMLFAFIADRWGRKPPAYVALLASTIAVGIFVSIDSPVALLWFAPVYSFITYPVFGLYGGYLSEMFPTEIRASAVNTIYNGARFLAFFGPTLMGFVASKFSMTFAIGSTAFLYAAAIIPLIFLPETIVKKNITGGLPTVSTDI